MASIQDQFLKAGLINAKTAKKATKEKRKETNLAKNSKEGLINEVKLSAEKTLAEKSQRDREQNLIRQEQANQKAITAQIKQLIEVNKITKAKGDIGYNFVDTAKIKKILVNKDQQQQLSLGHIAIVKLVENNVTKYELVPRKVAEKIAQRNEDYVVLINDNSNNSVEDEDPYAAYKIPDDLMW